MYEYSPTQGYDTLRLKFRFPVSEANNEVLSKTYILKTNDANKILTMENAETKATLQELSDGDMESKEGERYAEGYISLNFDRFFNNLFYDISYPVECQGILE